MTTITEMITFEGANKEEEKEAILQKNVDLANSSELYRLKNQLRGSPIANAATVEVVTAIPELTALDPDLLAKEKRKRRRNKNA